MVSNTLTHRPIRRRIASLAVVTALSASIVPFVPEVAGAAGIAPTSDATEFGAALTREENAGLVTFAEFVTRPPSGNPTAISDVTLADFPSDGPSYAIMSTGDATQAGNPNQEAFASVADGGGNVRGNTDFDVTILRLDLDVPDGHDCLQIDFRFLSEEFPEFKGSAFNDAFIAELDPVLGELSTAWTTNGSTITAPENFATDEDGNEVSVNGLGELRVTAGQAAGTIYDAADRERVDPDQRWGARAVPLRVRPGRLDLRLGGLPRRSADGSLRPRRMRERRAAPDQQPDDEWGGDDAARHRRGGARGCPDDRRP